MKKKVLIILLISVLLLGGYLLFFKQKVVYDIGEKATIDNYEITLTKAEYDITSNNLYATFLIKNLNNYSITPDENMNFKLLGLSQTEKSKTFNSNLNIIKPNTSTTYTINYNVDKKHEYLIYYYGRSNNKYVKFQIKNNQINEI